MHIKLGTYLWHIKCNILFIMHRYKCSTFLNAQLSLRIYNFRFDLNYKKSYALVLIHNLQITDNYFKLEKLQNKQIQYQITEQKNLLIHTYLLVCDVIFGSIIRRRNFTVSLFKRNLFKNSSSLHTLK